MSHLAFCWNDVATAPDVSITKANEPTGAVLNGDSITYTLTVTNDGTATATGVEVTDQLPAGVTFVSATAGCSEAAGLVTCALGESAPALPSVDITVTVDEEFCGPIVNAAHVSASNETGGATENNDSNDVSNSVECSEPTPPDLQVTKSSDADGILHEGDDFRYTITVTNVGNEEATDVELDDVLPPGALNVAIHRSPRSAARPAPSRAPRPRRASPTRPSSAVRSTSGQAHRPRYRQGHRHRRGCGSITNIVDVEGLNEPAENVGSDNHAGDR